MEHTAIPDTLESALWGLSESVLRALDVVEGSPEVPASLPGDLMEVRYLALQAFGKRNGEGEWEAQAVRKLGAVVRAVADAYQALAEGREEMRNHIVDYVRAMNGAVNEALLACASLKADCARLNGAS